MRETIKEVLSRTEQNQLGENVIEYNYSIVENKIEGAITATVQPYGRITTYNGVDFTSGFVFSAGDENKDAVEDLILADMAEIASNYGMIIAE